ncbi:MAG TPA: NAD(P)H-hydrate dehydratase [Usitatibacter sp.]|nr:NAD(P)H-hydrate dehydratase [Usitatibacter sp.]
MSAIPVLTLEELRGVEQRAAAQGVRLMERAGQALARAAAAIVRDNGAPVLVVAGPGNNGGDAWVAAAQIQESFHRVVVLDAAGTEPPAAEARAARERFKAHAGEIVREWPRELRASLIVDGLLGIGLSRDVDDEFAAIIGRMNASGTAILAIDVPSGLDSSSGRIRGAAVRATDTLTFIAHKPGLHTADGLDCVGHLECDDLGAQTWIGDAKGSLLEPGIVRDWLSPRPRNAHKGDFGTLSVIGGNRGMVGAALLAATAGLLCGAGKVRVGLLAADAPAVDPAHPELMLASVDDAMDADVVVAGPGAGQSPSATSVSMFERTVLPALLHRAGPLVLDADALNAIAFSEALENAVCARTEGPTILTPHPGEAARLLHRTTLEIGEDRVGAAVALARRYRAHVVLKGAGSVCASPNGRWSINTTGNAGLASGGTGDVLSGMIGALLAQKLAPRQALDYAVCLHGAAADACVERGIGPAGLTATEVALEARRLLNDWSRKI